MFKVSFIDGREIEVPAFVLAPYIKLHKGEISFYNYANKEYKDYAKKKQNRKRLS